MSERGSALIATLMVVVLLATLAAALALVISTESVTAANYVAAQQTLYAADAGIERAIAEFRLLTSWQSAPASASSSSDLNDGLSLARAPDGRTLDLVQLTARRQSESDMLYPNTPNRPVWRLFGHASMNQMTGDTANAPPYVAVWVADDPDDSDGDPATDTNDVIVVHAAAFGIRGGHREVEATIRREEAMAAGLPGAMRIDVRLIAWRELR
jgi:Tfp pilus assembly protein PilX